MRAGGPLKLESPEIKRRAADTRNQQLALFIFIVTHRFGASVKLLPSALLCVLYVSFMPLPRYSSPPTPTQ